MKQGQAQWDSLTLEIAVNRLTFSAARKTRQLCGTFSTLHAPQSSSMSSHHIIISGTGRAGTTFLVQLLTRLGFETGFANVEGAIDPNCNAGMEWDLRKPDAPYIVKSPWLCDYLDVLMEQTDMVIDHAIIPVRDLFAAAESRRNVVQRSKSDLPPSQILGGLWHTDRGAEQEAILSFQFYKLIHTLVKREIPTTFLHFPRLVHDPEYLYDKLRFLLNQIPFDRFLSEFTATARPDLVHVFKNQQTDVQDLS